VAADIENDRRVSIKKLAAAHGVSVDTIHRILHQDLGLEKKSVRWVPKLLSEAQNQERVRVFSDFVAAINRQGKDML
jgi:DeoR/GlpR family transcriptional regulator of sugar metabolism